MKPIFIEDVIKAVNGTINININTNNMLIKNISIDTRTIKEGDLFIAIEGENFDGHDFIHTAFEKGAIACISHKKIDTDKLIINVKDTKDSLKELAMYYRNLFNIQVIALTGSAGKTTTKDMLAHCLSKKYKTLKTQGNFNNEIGLPLTIFNIEDDTQVVVLEMGMNHFNEISNLSKIAKPDIALITNIGVAHVENLGNREGVLRAKYEIFDYLKEDGIKVLNGDDDMLSSLNEEKGLFYSLNNKNLDAYAHSIEEKGINGTDATINYLNKSFKVSLKIPGKHILSNALAVTLICNHLGLDKNQIKDGLETFKPESKMRMDIIKTKRHTIINDVYNANPSSMKATLDVLASTEGRKMAILGDMFELGEFSKNEHFNIGKYATEQNIEELVFIGNSSYYMLNGAKSNKNSLSNINYFKTQEDFIKNIDNFLKLEATILVKASRGMKLENTIDEILRRENNGL